MPEPETPPRRRLLVFALIAVVVGGIALIDRDREPPAPPVEAPTPGVVMPVAFGAASLTSTWFCVGGTVAPDAFADHRVVLANPTDEPIIATVTIYAGTLDTDTPENRDAITALEPVVHTESVGARDRRAVRLGDFIEAPYASALVEAPGGGLVVEHEVVGSSGRSAAPCATAASDTWYFASGQVTQETGEQLVLFNPFSTPAVVDLSFATTDGFRTPPEYQGFPIPAGEMTVVDVFTAAGRHDQISTAVIARAGKVVADRLMHYGGTPRGLTVALGAPQAARAWSFPDGQIGDGLNELYSVYNPSDRPAELDVEIRLVDPDVNGAVDPIPLSVDPHSFAQVLLNDSGRVPAGVAHSVVVRSQNGVGVVAERRLSSTSPAPRTGISDALGSPLAATTWVAAAGDATEATAEFLIVLNPSSDTIARIDVKALAGGQLLEVEGLQDVEVGPAGRVAIDIGQHVNREGLSLVVESTQVVVVERAIYAASGPGLSQSICVPLPAGVVVYPS